MAIMIQGEQMKKKIVFVWWGHIRKYINPSQSVSKKKKKEIDNLRISRSCSHIIYYSNVPVEFVTKFKCEEHF